MQDYEVKSKFYLMGEEISEVLDKYKATSTEMITVFITLLDFVCIAENKSIEELSEVIVSTHKEFY